MNEIYIVNGKKYEVSPNRKQEFLEKFPDAQLVETLGKTTPTTKDAVVEVNEASNTELPSASTSLELSAPKSGIKSLYDIYATYDDNAPQRYNVDNPVGQFLIDKLAGFGSSALNLLSGAGDFAEAVAETKILKAVDLWNVFASDDFDVTQETKNKISDTIESVFFVDDALAIGSDFLEKFTTEREYSGIFDAFKKGDVLEGIDMTLTGISQAIPSVIAAAAGPIGLGVIGASVTGQKYEEKSELNPEDRGLAMLGISAVQGGVETLSELVTRGIFRGAAKSLGVDKLTRDAAKKIIGRVASGAFFEGSSEVGAQEVNNVIDAIYDERLNRFVDENGNFDGQIVLERVFDNFLISSFVGGGIPVVQTFTPSLEADRLTPIKQQKEKAKIIAQINELKEDNKDINNPIVSEEINDLERKINIINFNIQETVKTFTNFEKLSAISLLKQITDIKADKKNKNLSQSAIKKLTDLEKQNQNKLQKLFDRKQNQLFKSREAKLEQNIQSAASITTALKFNKAPQVFDNENSYFEKIAENENISLDQAKKTAKGTNGVFLGKGDIYINKTEAVKVNAFTVGTHEVLHPILNALIGNAKSQGKIISDFKASMSQSQLDYMNRQMAGIDINSDTYNTEFITKFSDGILKNEITYNKNIFERIGEFLKNLFRQQGFDNIDFTDGQQVYEFIKQYNTSIAKTGQVNQSIIRQIQARERETGRATATVGRATQIQESRSNVKALLEKYNNNVTEMINFSIIPKDSNFSDYTTSTFGQEILPIVNSITNKYFEPIPGNSLRILAPEAASEAQVKSEARKVYKNELVTLAATIVSREYKTEEEGGQPIDKFITTRLFNRAKTLAKDLGVEETIKGRIDSETEQIIEGDFTANSSAVINEYNAETERTDQLINPVDSLGKANAADYYGIVATEIEAMSLEQKESLLFATTRDLAPGITSKVFGISEDKLRGVNKEGKPTSTNFSPPHTTAQQFIYDNIVDFILLLPKGSILEGESIKDEYIGTGTKLPRKIQQLLYEKAPRLTKEAGLLPFVQTQKTIDLIEKVKKLKDKFEIKEISKEKLLSDTRVLAKDYLKAHGINQDGTFDTFKGSDPQAATLLASARLYGRVLTNSAVRIIDNLNIEQKTNFKAGTSPLQFSLTHQSSLQDEKNVPEFANLVINKLREIASQFEIVFPENEILLADKSKGNQKFYLNKLEKFTDEQEKLLDFFPKELKNNKTLTGSILAMNYREDSTGYDFEANTYKTLVDKNGNLIEDIEKIKNIVKRKRAAYKEKFFISEGKKNNYSKKTKELLNDFNSELKQAKEKGLFVRAENSPNSASKISGIKKELNNIPVNIETAKKITNKASKFNNLNTTTAKLVISLMRDFVNNSSNKADAVQSIIIMLTANRNTVNSFRSLSTINRLMYDPNKKTEYHLEHDKSMALIVQDILQQVLSDGDITFDSTASIIPVELKEIRDSKNDTKVSEKSKFDEIFNEYLRKNPNLKVIALDTKNNPVFQESKTDVFNEMIGRTSNIDSKAVISDAKATVLGRKKGKFKFFIAPSADDLMGLLYYTVGKGEQGNKDLKWIKENITDPFAKGINEFTAYRQSLMSQFRTIKKQLKGQNVNLKQVNSSGYTNELAIRTYILAKQGIDIKSLNKEEVQELVNIVQDNSNLKDFATKIINLTQFAETPTPDNGFISGTLTTDILDYLNTSSREKFLEKYLSNVNEIFGKSGTDGKLKGEIANKLRAAYGDGYIEALSDILYRMKTGRSRPSGANKLTNTFINWINNSVGAIMFFNTRSALLQQLSFVNFINLSDNNPLAATAAFTNQKQFWSDYSTLFNSNFLKSRRAGLKTDVNADEIAKAAEEGKNPISSVLSTLLKKGFLPTQIADSHAISLGGASFYRNRIKRYLKEGKNQEEAQKQAFLDFQENAETSQQSSRPDKISMQQASSLGRLVLAFANTPMQYARLFKRAGLDLVNKRGDWKTNLSKLLYYGAVQNILFSTLQSALFALMFDEEQEEEEVKDRYFRVGNSVSDSFLRGLGFAGAATATGKNMVLEAIRQAKKNRPDYERVALRALSLSPPVDSKIRKLASAGRTFTYKNTREKMKNEGFSLDNPIFEAGGQTISALTNLPADRVIRKLDNLSTPVRQEVELWQAISLALGYSKWDVNLIEKTPKPKPKTTGLFEPVKFKKVKF